MIEVKWMYTGDHSVYPWNPQYQHLGDSGIDLHSRVNKIIFPFFPAVIPTGIAIDLPLGHEAQIRPRSGLASKGLLASFGTIDGGYRGELRVVMYNLTLLPKEINYGDRIAQLVITGIPRGVWFNRVDTLSQTSRGNSGFGSTGVRGYHFEEITGKKDEDPMPSLRKL